MAYQWINQDEPESAPLRKNVQEPCRFARGILQLSHFRQACLLIAAAAPKMSTQAQSPNSQATSALNPSDELSAADLSRIVEMAWEDRTPFEAVQQQFGLNEAAVIKLMRAHLKPSSFKLWRQRMQGRATKHAALRAAALTGGHRHQARHRIPQR
jgi:uncharacterized protein (TIGR03643 family)